MTILVALFWILELNIENEYSMSLSLWCEGIKFLPIRIYTRLTKILKNLYCTILNYSQNEKNLIKNVRINYSKRSNIIIPKISTCLLNLHYQVNLKSEVIFILILNLLLFWEYKYELAFKNCLKQTTWNQDSNIIAHVFNWIFNRICKRDVYSILILLILPRDYSTENVNLTVNCSKYIYGCIYTYFSEIFLK